ncbi:unnamed protein product [Bursaphelenchus xylophilus]|uniref:UMP-CMP kinase n=1 Tax=Bursaphelenchus xylophilus TaxID=6326 RepID=A0A1I7SCF8_BURXY|nr:unnamed protein product [Bursaphelenchus xylophilus]CAG9094196.1 unnamed protein product [Bursaphelenchus xylophilus]
MELPDPFLPGAISLLDQLDKRMMVMLRDGKTLIGDLRTIDQFANLVLHNTLERIYVDNFYGDIPRGMFLIRGENVVLAGELTEDEPKGLTKVSLEEILRMQKVKQEEKEERDKARRTINWVRFVSVAPGKAQNFRVLSRFFSDFRPQVSRSSSRMSTESTGPTQHNVVFVLGPPGSGKGTQCARIQEKFGFVHLSAGDLLRAERQREGSEFGELIETHIKNGSIVPVEITCKLIENAMLAAGDAQGFLVDGFPRNKNNLDGWQKEMNDKTKVHFVLYLSAPLEVCVKRCLGRSQGRADDNEESLQKRIVTYNEQTLPIIEYYRDLGMVREISSEPGPDQVFADVEKVFNDAGFKSH